MSEEQRVALEAHLLKIDGVAMRGNEVTYTTARPAETFSSIATLLGIDTEELLRINTEEKVWNLDNGSTMKNPLYLAARNARLLCGTTVKLTHTAAYSETAYDSWAQCDICDKWRVIPTQIDTSTIFECSFVGVSCEVAEDEYTEAPRIVLSPARRRIQMVPAETDIEEHEEQTPKREIGQQDLHCSPVAKKRCIPDFEFACTCAVLPASARCPLPTGTAAGMFAACLSACLRACLYILLEPVLQRPCGVEPGYCCYC